MNHQEEHLEMLETYLGMNDCFGRNLHGVGVEFFCEAIYGHNPKFLRWAMIELGKVLNYMPSIFEITQKSKEYKI